MQSGRKPRNSKDNPLQQGAEVPPDHSTNSGNGAARSVAGLDLAIQHCGLETLIPYARNARTHSDAQVAQIAASIREFGWTNPVLVDGKNGIIAGHGRVLAARKLGLTSVPVIELSGLSDAQRRAYILADNKLALNAGWDDLMLAAEVADLNALGVDLNLAGFDAGEIDKLLGLASAHHGLTDPDEVPDAPDVPVTRIGDVWLLGRHRLVCGDCTDPDVVARALDGVAPHLMVTDPPYGVEYKPSWRNEVIRSDGSRVAARATGEVLNDDRADWREAWALFPGEVAYVWHGALHAPLVAQSLESAGFAMSSPDYLGQDPARDRSRRLPLAARALLVRCPEERKRPLGGRSQADHRVGYPAPEERDRPRDTKASRLHAAADREQFLAGAGHLRALLRVRHHHHRSGDEWARVPRDRAEPGLCRRRGAAVAGLHRPSGSPGEHGRDLLD
jgi:hypothetical protein